VRSFFLTIASGLFVLLHLSVALAQTPEGFEKIYDAPTNVNLGGRWVVADIELYADMTAAQENELHVALVTDVTKFIEETEQDLENWIATHQDRCGERWSASEPIIEFPPGSIRFIVEIELEIWNCGFRGRGEPGRFAREAGRIDVTLDPYIEDGKLQARLQSFYVDDREGVSKYLPLEFVARRVVNSELDKLNKNRKFYRAPNPFADEGFEYESIRGRKLDGDRVVITARYRAAGGPEVLDRLVEAVRGDGITQ
jgi:hypothetical protein